MIILRYAAQPSKHLKGCIWGLYVVMLLHHLCAWQAAQLLLRLCMQHTAADWR